MNDPGRQFEENPLIGAIENEILPALAMSLHIREPRSWEESSLYRHNRVGKTAWKR